MPYLDHAATSLPKPPEVVAAMVAALSEAGNPSRGGHRYATSAERVIDQARLRVARLLGVQDPRRIVFTLNGTDALNIAIHAVLGALPAASARPHVVTTVLEHNSITRPLETLRAAGRIDVTRVRASAEGFVDPADVIAAIRPETALVAVTMASNALGTLQPVEAIVKGVEGVTGVTGVTGVAGVAGVAGVTGAAGVAGVAGVARIAGAARRAGARDTSSAARAMGGSSITRADGTDLGPLVLVDAAQVLGAVPVDLAALGADLVACPGHKALLGPMGTGILYVGPRAMPSIDGAGSRLGVFRSGGTGGDSRLETMPPELPHRLEGGTPNVVGIAGLGAGAAWVAERGVEAIRAHEMALVQRAIDGLGEIRGVGIVGPRDAARRAGAVSITIEGLDPLDAGAILDSSFDIAVRPGLHCAPGAHRAAGTFPHGTVRMSVGATTIAGDVDAFVRAVAEIASVG
ncbi:MAG: aminotransferase class V-fold PLP-dependent enzyme [Phycisphaerales bacterium]